MAATGRSHLQDNDGKLASFLAAFDLVGEILLDRLRAELAGPGEPMERLEGAIAAYLSTLADEPAYARLFLVEVYAAGPAAMARRALVQQRIVDALVELLGAQPEASRFACQILVAGVGAMVNFRLTNEQERALRQAAALTGQSMSGFVLAAAVEHAQVLLERANHIELSAAEFKRFTTELDKPAEVVPELVKLFNRNSRIATS